MFSAALYACARTFCAHCAQDRGCSAHPAFPAPSVWRGRETPARLGRDPRREIASTHSAVIARLDRATQYPETLMIKSRSRGVLDHPLSRMTTAAGGVVSLALLQNPNRKSALSTINP